MSKLNLSAVLEVNGEEKDLYAMKEEERKEISRQLVINFGERLGCKVKGVEQQ